MSKKSIIKGKTKVKLAGSIAAVALMGSSLGLTSYAYAAPKAVSRLFPMGQRAKHLPGIMGTVSDVNGSSITVLGKNNTTYSVNAQNAKIVKDKNTEISLSDIKDGDVVIVKGTVDGTDVTAEVIRDGKFPAGFRKGIHKGLGVRGVVSSLNGNLVTIVGKDNVTYKIDASSAKIIKSKTNLITVSDISSGDMIFVRGSINGTDITAKAIFDGLKVAKK